MSQSYSGLSRPKLQTQAMSRTGTVQVRTSWGSALGKKVRQRSLISSPVGRAGDSAGAAVQRKVRRVQLCSCALGALHAIDSVAQGRRLPRGE